MRNQATFQYHIVTDNSRISLLFPLLLLYVGQTGCSRNKRLENPTCQIFPSCRNSLTHTQEQQPPGTWRSNLGTSQDQPSLNYCQFDSTSRNTEIRQTAHYVRLTSTSASRTQSEALTPELCTSGMKPDQRESSPSLVFNLPICRTWDDQVRALLGLTKHVKVHHLGCS